MGPNKKTICLLVCFFAVLIAPLKGSVDLDDIRRKALKYNRPSSSSSRTQAKVAEALKQEASTPKSRFVDPTETELSRVDKNYLLVHMKLANRHFTRKDYQRANHEIDLVFTKDPSHSGARFMRAVISARLKNYDSAWYNILIAKDKDPNNKKITDFVERLKTVKEEPDPPFWVKDIYRSMPISACEKCSDIIENLLNKQISQYITKIIFKESTELGKKVTIPVEFQFSYLPENPAQFRETIKSASNVGLANETIGSNSISYNIEITDLPLKNPKATKVIDLREFIKGVNEDIDVAIEDTEEHEPNNGVMMVNYKISVRSFDILNDFLRTISPYVEKFHINNMTLS